MSTNNDAPIQRRGFYRRIAAPCSLAVAVGGLVAATFYDEAWGPEAMAPGLGQTLWTTAYYLIAILCTEVIFVACWFMWRFSLKARPRCLACWTYLTKWSWSNIAWPLVPVFVTGFLVCVVCLFAIAGATTYGHRASAVEVGQSPPEVGDQAPAEVQGENATDATGSPLWNTARQILAAPELRLPLGLAALILVCLVALGMRTSAWIIRKRWTKRTNTILDLVKEGALCAATIQPKQDADKQIELLLLQQGPVRKVTFLGGRFGYILSSESAILNELKTKSPGVEIEVIYHDPLHPEAIVREITLGFDRESGVLIPLKDCIENVRRLFPNGVVSMVSKPVDHRLVLLEYAEGVKVVSIQEYRFGRLGRYSGGYVISEDAVPKACKSLERRLDVVKSNSIVLEEQWINDPRHIDQVRTFCRRSKILRKRTASAAECVTAILDHDVYGRFILDQGRDARSLPQADIPEPGAPQVHIPEPAAPQADAPEPDYAI